MVKVKRTCLKIEIGKRDIQYARYVRVDPAGGTRGCSQDPLSKRGHYCPKINVIWSKKKHKFPRALGAISILKIMFS